MMHQPAIRFSISFQPPFNRAGRRTSNAAKNKTMKHLVILFFAITGFALAESPDATSLPSKLQGIASELFQALQEENIEKAISLFHPDSPNRATTQKSYEAAFPTTQISYELKDFSYIGKDDKFAVVRFTQSIGILELNGKKVTDPRRARLEIMMLFRPSGDSWKIWKSVEIERLPPQ